MSFSSNDVHAVKVNLLIKIKMIRRKKTKLVRMEKNPIAPLVKHIRLITFLVLAIFILSACSKKKSTNPPPSLPKWTILGYFDGNNYPDASQTKNSYVIKDAQQMEQVGSTKDIQVIVMLGSIKTGGNCNYYLIEKYLEDSTDSISSKVLDSLGQKDMSDPQTMRDFIKYGLEHYPAEHYMLIINDHGLGWQGVCSDDTIGPKEMMTLPELSSFALSGYKFDIIVFNAPSMSMLEVAYQLKDEANYLVASQYYDLGRNLLGFPIWLQSLANNPNTGVKILARNIAIAIYTTAVDKPTEVSISAIDLSKVDALTSKMADFGSKLVTHTGDYWKEVVDTRGGTTPFPHFLPYYFDLKNFSQNIQSSINLDSTIKNAAQSVEDAIYSAVVKMSSNPPSDYGGLCIHFPVYSQDFDSSRYVQLDFAVSNWHIFLSRFIQAYAEANSGSLRIVSEPVKGARIFLDGQDTGLETDTTIHGIPVSPHLHTIKLVKAGYREVEWKVMVEEAGTTKVVIIPFGYPSLSRESLSELQ
jgi:hypothetical protein